jgi:hypothetical protein
MQVWTAPDGSDHQEYFTARVVEHLRGADVASELAFFAHAEGEPGWRSGEQAVLFLQRTALRPEFAKLAERFPFFTVQGAGQEWRLTGDTATEVHSAIRAWAILKEPPAADDVRQLLLRQLRCKDQRLQADAVAELVQARQDPKFLANTTQVEPFAQLIREGGLETPRRIALARALEGAPGFDSGAALLQLSAQPLSARERTALIRAAGMSRDPKMSAWLGKQLRNADGAVQREAVAALGRPWHAAQVPALLSTARQGTEPIALAAIRALAAIDSPDAHRALKALEHDPRLSVANAARAAVLQSTSR